MTQACESARQRGRPPKDASELLRHRYPTRWTDEEWEQLRKAAKLLGVGPGPGRLIKDAALRRARRVLRREGKG